ncbi:MAG: DUF2634 domain-containing protein [Bacteroidaceae bacterium]|nr:DUF2634 domain-containing protein [Bacteroidaceae bacterium]
MLPETLNIKYANTSIPSKTYKIDWETSRIEGFIDGKDAIRQAIDLALTTERCLWRIYSWNYGSEIHTLIGKSDAYAMSEMKRMIQDALSQDSRVTDTSDFVFEAERGNITCQFVAKTTVGEINATV